MTTQQKSDFITESRTEATRLLDAVAGLRSLNAQSVSTDMLNQLEPEDFTGANEGLSAAEITAVYSTLVALETLLGAGHATNLYKVAL